MAQLLTPIPQPRRNLLCYCGHYANRARGKREKTQWPNLTQATTRPCSEGLCGGQLRVIGFITEQRVNGKILQYLERVGLARGLPEFAFRSPH